MDLNPFGGWSTHGIFGSKPSYKAFKPKPVDLGEQQRKGIQANITAYPDISKLGDLYSQDELAKLEQILPGYGENLSAGGAATKALFEEGMPLLHGEVPQDVQEAVQRSDAYKSLIGGYGGSPMAHALTARDLGLTSLQLMNQGAALTGQGYNTLQAWDALARKDMLNPASMFVSPEDQYTSAMNQELQRQAYKRNVSQIRASPSPTQSGVYNSLMQVLGEVLSIYGGGSGGFKPVGGGQQSTFGYGNPATMSAYPGGLGAYATGGYGSPVFNAGYVNTSYVPQYPSGYSGDPNLLYGSNPFGG